MCTIDNTCYTITNGNGFYDTELQCKEAIYALVTREDFPTLYMYADDITYNVADIRCINWSDKPA